MKKLLKNVLVAILCACLLVPTMFVGSEQPFETIYGADLSISSDISSLSVGQSVKLVYSLSETEAVNLEWSVDNTSVVVVSSDGVLTAVGPGSAYVQATLKDAEGQIVATQSKSCYVNTPSISIKNSNLSGLKIGETIQLECYEPENFVKSNYSVTYEITDNEDDAFSLTSSGALTARGSGSAYVYAILHDGDKTYKSSEKYCSVGSASLSVSVSDRYLSIGDSVKIQSSVDGADLSYFTLEYKSDNTNVVKVANDGTVTAVSPGSTDVEVTLKYGSKVIDTTTVYFTVESADVTLSVNTDSIKIGGTAKFSVKGSGISLKKAKVQYVVSNKSRMTVDSNGKAKGRAAGTVNVYAKVTVGSLVLKSNTVRMTVQDPYVRLSKSYVYMTMGKKKQLKASIVGGSGKIKWSSGKKSIAKVSSKGVITAVKYGTTTIKATTKIGGKTYTSRCTVVVNSPSLSSTYMTLSKTEKARLRVYSKGNKKVKWSSTKPSVVSVDSKGNIKGKKQGRAAIIATVAGKKLKCTVTVYHPQISYSRLEVTKGFTTSNYMYYTNGNKIKWSTSNSSVATVNSDGEIRGRGVGTCTIYGRVNGITRKCKVKVYANVWKNEYPKRMEDLAFDSQSLDLKKAYFSGKKLVLEYYFLNKKEYKYSRFDSLRISIKRYGTEVMYKEKYKVKVKMPSYSRKKVKVVLNTGNLYKELDLRTTAGFYTVWDLGFGEYDY